MARTFSQSEKEFLRKLVQYNEQQLNKKIFLYEISSFITEQIISDELIEINDHIIPMPPIRHYKKITINVPKGYSKDSAFSIYYAFYEIIFLLSWLEESHLVSFSPYTDIGCGEQICKLTNPDREEYIPFDIPQDEMFVENVCRLLFGKCFIHNTLYDFVKNDFKTFEERDAEKSHKEAEEALHNAQEANELSRQSISKANIGNRCAIAALVVAILVGAFQCYIGTLQLGPDRALWIFKRPAKEQVTIDNRMTFPVDAPCPISSSIETSVPNAKQIITGTVTNTTIVIDREETNLPKSEQEETSLESKREEQPNLIQGEKTVESARTRFRETETSVPAVQTNPSQNAENGNSTLTVKETSEPVKDNFPKLQDQASQAVPLSALSEKPSSSGEIKK